MHFRRVVLFQGLFVANPLSRRKGSGCCGCNSVYAVRDRATCQTMVDYVWDRGRTWRARPRPSTRRMMQSTNTRCPVTDFASRFFFFGGPLPLIHTCFLYVYGSVLRVLCVGACMMVRCERERRQEQKAQKARRRSCTL